MTSTALVSHRIAKITKEVDAGITVVAGGVHPQSMPEDTLRNAAIDFIVRGDGEPALLELCRRLPRREIRGLSFRDGEIVVHNPPRADIKDLGVLPDYAYHLVEMDKYFPAVGAYRKWPAINMLMTRGCPGKCIFCNSAETTLRTRPAPMVIEEIIRLRDSYGIREVQFYDDTFTVLKKNVLEFCRLMKERKVGVGFSCFARADCFNEEMAQALKDAGCHQVMFGVESGSQAILRVLRKDIDLAHTMNAVKLAKKVGIEVRAAFTLGNPGETVETIQETMAYALKLDPDLAIFNITTPYPGTQMYNWAKKNSLLTTHDWWDYEIGQAIVDLPSISKEELEHAYEQAFKIFYNRPKVYWRRLKSISSWRQFRDSFDAFFQIFFKMSLTKRGHYQQGWLRWKREDFFDYSFLGGRDEFPIPRVLADEALLGKAGIAGYSFLKRR